MGVDKTYYEPTDRGFEAFKKILNSRPPAESRHVIPLRARWQAGKTVIVPKVSWDQRRMLPVEITSLNTANMMTSGNGVREPIAGVPVPVGEIDLVIVPGLGFTASGFRIGRGMGFYDRFLAQEDFLGVSCGLAFEEQIVSNLPILDHDIPLSMLATDQGIRRVASHCIEKDSNRRLGSRPRAICDWTE